MSDFMTQTDKQDLGRSSAFNTYYTYSFIDNSKFYALVPPAYMDFYRRFVRQWFYWYDGYVPYFHQSENGIFSTRLATTLVRNMASQINGGQLMLDEDEPTNNKDALTFAEKWAKKNDLSNKIDTSIEYAGAGGTSALKLNSDGKDLWFEPLRLDQFFVDVSWDGKVEKYIGFVYSYTKTVPDKSKNHLYYLLEERWFDDNGQPFVKYIVKRATENIATTRSVDLTDIQQIEWESIPKTVRKSIKRDYGVVTIDKPIKLPFEDNLGVYLMKYTPHVSNIPSIQFGESMFSTIISYLLSYDYYYSAMNTNMYLGRSRVMIPKTMKNPHNKYQGNYNDGLDSFTYVSIPYTNGQTGDQKPIPLQFDLRGKSWMEYRNMILEGIATALNINVSTLASYLGDNVARTAREISTEEGATTLYVENKRELIKKPINDMLDAVLKFYGKQANVVVKFSKAGLTNMRNLVEIAQILKTTGLADIETIQEFIFNDKTPAQLKKILERTKAEEEEKRKLEQEKKIVNFANTKNDNTIKDEQLQNPPEKKGRLLFKQKK